MARNKDPSNAKRSNYWCGLVYPDSAPKDWLARLDKLHIKAVVSPLHSPDPDPDTEFEKKSHYHVMIMYDSVKTINQAREDFSSFGAINYIIIPSSKIGMLKYFCHLKNPSKEKLNPADVLCFGGVDYLEEIADDGSSIYYMLMDMTRHIHLNHVCSFIGFILWCEVNKPDWARVAATKSSLYIKAVISSERNFVDDSIRESQQREDNDGA